MDEWVSHYMRGSTGICTVKLFIHSLTTAKDKDKESNMDAKFSSQPRNCNCMTFCRIIS